MYDSPKQALPASEYERSTAVRESKQLEGCQYPYGIEAGRVCGYLEALHRQIGVNHAFVSQAPTEQAEQPEVEQAKHDDMCGLFPCPTCLQAEAPDFHAQALAIVKRHTAKADVNEAFVDDIARELKMASARVTQSAKPASLLFDFDLFVEAIEGAGWARRDARHDGLRRLWATLQPETVPATQPPIAPDAYVIPQIVKLASAMQFKLNKNAHKTGWQSYDQNGVRIWDASMLAFLKGRLVEEVEELFAEVPDGDKESIRFEAADVANLAMMIADVCGGLNSLAPDAPGEQAAPVAEGGYTEETDRAFHGYLRTDPIAQRAIREFAAEREAEKAAPNRFAWVFHDSRRIALSNGPIDALVVSGNSESSWLDISETNARIVENAFNRRASIDLASLSAERCAQILTAIEWLGKNNWIADGGVVRHSKLWSYDLYEAQIICAYHLERGGLVREGEAK